MTQANVEIYGLYDPDTAELRYVGKAKSAAERLKRHIQESRALKRPVNNWVRKLLAAGKLPNVRVLATVPHDAWQDEEIRLIALHRKAADLLNVADGGDMPSQTIEQRKAAGRASQKVLNADPKIKALNKAKADYSRLATSLRKHGNVLDYWCMKYWMHQQAIENPKYCGTWRLPDEFINRSNATRSN